MSSRPAIVLQAILVIALGCATTYCWFVRWSVFAQPPDTSAISVYSAHTNYVVPLIDHNGTTYVGLVELLEPLGTVDAHADGKKYKLKFTPPGSREMELQFHDGKDKGKVKGENTKLGADFLIQNGRGYVPLSSISELLAHALSVQIRMNQAAGRLFVGDIGQRFTLELRPGNPSKLFVNFDSQVNPTIATGPGYIRFTFRREPVVPSIDHVSYNDPLITGAKFSEHDGIAELDVSGNSALMANFADAGRTIVVTGAPLPPPPPVAQQAAPPAATAPVAAPPPQPQAPAPPRFLVLIDPAHGGTEIGAAISPTLAEKDVVLALARRLQRELSTRGISAALLRNSDVTIPLDQRAISANAARPALYISLHAANSGSGVHVFTSLLNQENYASRDFLPWNNAQSAYLDLSSVVAGSVAAELEGHKLPNILLAAPLRPMNNVAAPAIAVEIAPPAGDVADIASAAYQEQVAQSVAGAVAAIRSKIPEVRP